MIIKALGFRNCELLAEIANLSDYWCPREDSNLEPTDYESAALTVELQGHRERYRMADSYLIENRGKLQPGGQSGLS